MLRAFCIVILLFRDNVVNVECAKCSFPIASKVLFLRVVAAMQLFMGSKHKHLYQM